VKQPIYLPACKVPQFSTEKFIIYYTSCYRYEIYLMSEHISAVFVKRSYFGGHFQHFDKNLS